VPLIELADVANAVALVLSPRRRQRQVWGFRASGPSRPRIIVETTEGGRTELYTRPNVGFGAVTAVAQLTSALNPSSYGVAGRILRRARRSIEICSISDSRADGWSGDFDTVLIGGPKNNRLTHAALAAFGCQPSPGADPLDEVELIRRTGDRRRSEALASGLGVATQGNTIYWFGTPYRGDVGDLEVQQGGTSGYEGHDYGVVLRLPGLHAEVDSPRRMVVVFGSQTFGVGAAAAWLVNVRSRRVSRSHRILLASHPNIAVLVKADVVDGVAGDPVLVDIVALPARLPRWFHEPDPSQG
jgi:hypothetical protein